MSKVAGRVGTACVMVAVLAATWPVDASALPNRGAVKLAPANSIVVKAPKTATVGDLVTIEVMSTSKAPVAAFEVTATIDPAAGRIEGAETRPSGPTGLRDMSIADLTGYGVLAAYTPAGVPVRSGSRRLGTFLVRLDAPGTAEVRIGSAELATALGAVTRLADPAPVRITVAGAAGTPAGGAFAAPALPWSLATDTTATPRWSPQTDAELDWQTSRLAKAPCSAALDAAAGGCLSVADVQVLAAEAVPTTTTTTTGRTATTSATTSATTASAATAAAAVTPFVVNDLADTWDSNVGNGICRTAAGVCTLRAAMQEANAIAGPNTINFAIPGAGPFRINLTQRLPAVTDTTGGVTIDGYTQPGAAPNTDPVVSNAVIKIEIVGTGPTFDGFVLNSGGNVLRGLSIYNLRRPIWIYRSGASAPGNVIRGDFVGTDPTGTFGMAQQFDEGMGIKAEQDSANTVIGGVDPADRNVISGNGRQGIGLWHSFTDNTVIYGNIVGLSPLGDRALPNMKHGVDFNFGVSGSILGGLAPGERNVISGNADTGVEISHTSATTNNVVTGNFIGTDVTGNRAPAYTANANTGVYVEDGVFANVIQDNVIGNNLKGGVRILNGGLNGVSTGMIVRRNRIGVSLDGTPIPNGQVGVSVDGSDTDIGPDNIIANNGGGGIISNETDALRNTFTHNSIFGNAGLSIDLAPLNTVNPNDVDDADAGPNDLLNHPVITTASDTEISGTACAQCTVEIYSTGTTGAGNGPLRTFAVAATTDAAGAFSVPTAPLTVGTWISATAIDSAGNTSEPADNVLISRANTAPTVDAGADFTINEGQSRSLQATATDPDGDVLAYAWDLDGNGSFERAGNPVTYVAPNIGPATVTISVQVTDGRGGVAVDSLVATINDVPPPPQPPVARFTFAPEIVAGDPLTISLQDGFDPDSTQPLTYSFDCGAGYGPFAASASTVCTGLPAGAPTVRGRVRDADGTLNEYTARAIVHANGLQNGSFETGTGATAPGWTNSTNLARQSATVRSGSFALGNTTSGTALAKQPFTIGDLHMVQRGAVNIPASSGTASFVERVRWYNSTGTLISTTTAPAVTGPTNGWVMVSLDLTVPTNARTAVAEYAWTVSGAARIYLDDAAVTNANQLANPDFETDANADGRPDTWWQLSRFTQSSAERHLGSFSGQAASDGTAFTPGQKISQVVPGVTYDVSTWLNVPAASSASSIRVTVRWLAAGSNNTISAPLLTSRAGATPGWVWIGGSLTAPAGAAFAYIELRFVGLTGEAYLDTAYFGRT